MAAVALLESLSADGVLSLGAAAVTHLIKYHVVSCDDDGEEDDKNFYKFDK